jgi:hypothetical protein
MGFDIYDSKGYVGRLSSAYGTCQLDDFLLSKGSILLNDFVKNGYCIPTREIIQELSSLRSDKPDVETVLRNLENLMRKSEDMVCIWGGVGDSPDLWHDIHTGLCMMNRWAREKKEYLSDNPNTLSEDQYIRVSSRGFRAVSLYDKTPLMKFKEHPTKKISTIIEHFQSGQPKEAQKPVPERRIQSWLIKQSLAGNNLSRILGLGLIYDELRFLLDEINLRSERCDMLCIGVARTKLIPVLIELKSQRLMKTIDQLIVFQKVMEKCVPEFKQLLTTCVGGEVDFSSGIDKIMIWPASGNNDENPKVIRRANESNIKIVGYEWDSRSPISGIRFTNKPIS